MEIEQLEKLPDKGLCIASTVGNDETPLLSFEIVVHRLGLVRSLPDSFIPFTADSVRERGISLWLLLGFSNRLDVMIQSPNDTACSLH